jgi:ATP-dependent DNA helicase RecG
MLPKAKSGTTSSRSDTSDRRPGGDGLDTPIQFIKGVGPRLGAVFRSRDIETVRDLLHFFPRAYEDRTRLLKIAQLVAGEKASCAVTVLSARKIPIRKLGRSMLEVRCRGQESDTNTLSLKWFHAPRGLEARFIPGAQLIVTGVAKSYMGKMEIVHPEISWGVSSHAGELDAHQPNVGRVVPVYVEIEGVPSRTLRKILWEALEKHGSHLTEDLPDRVLKTHGLPRAAEAVRTIHFPPESGTIEQLVKFNTPAHWRLIYEEFFKFEYLVLRQRLRMERESAPAIGLTCGQAAASDLERCLPFALTGDQKVAIREISEDIARPHPMNRLIQGDVGSGKTAVAFLTAGIALAEGGQAALMAPTEILAEQHYKNAVKLFGGRLNVALLTGKTTTSERGPLLARLGAGEPILLIGTHALIEDPVVFANLVYVMIDEQHRFGVDQRRTLKDKGTRADPLTGRPTLPHSLILSATPIPRTLALTAYGDLSVTSIQEMPPGRSPVITRLCRDRSERARALEQIREELRKGRQAYFIFPLVNDSEAEGFTQLKSAVAESDRLAKEVFPEFRVGLLHGQMKSDEKAAIMERFQRGELDVLVSTTVVEVGVDVANATVMVVEHSERFGLSQLHQLRGRVGRGSHQSYCFLLANARAGETTEARLEVLVETNDGFKIAEADLEIRGPGEFLGTRQAGGLPFRMANLVRDRNWLLKARDDATELLRSDPDLEHPEHAPLRRYYEREGSLQFERLKTS